MVVFAKMLGKGSAFFPHGKAFRPIFHMFRTKKGHLSHFFQKMFRSLKIFGLICARKAGICL